MQETARGCADAHDACGKSFMDASRRTSTPLCESL